MAVGRFAPSTTGEAHPGTLLAALLAWLDMRARRGRFVVRLENLDHLRCKPAWSAQMLDDLRWLGLDWDEVVDQQARHAAGLGEQQQHRARDQRDHDGQYRQMTRPGDHESRSWPST
jgi:glutamyl/glutaminyl-tRNA synthetase